MIPTSGTHWMQFRQRYTARANPYLLFKTKIIKTPKGRHETIPSPDTHRGDDPIAKTILTPGSLTERNAMQQYNFYLVYSFKGRRHTE